MDELVDVVDENDNVIGQEMKSVCHAKHILHRTTTILVFKDSSLKETLIQKRSLDKEIAPGLLSFTGGHLKAGDTYLSGAKRELQEELFHNHELPKEIKFKKLFKIKNSMDQQRELKTVWSTVYPGPFYLQPEEVDELYFENIDILAKKIAAHPEQYSETSRMLFKEYTRRYL
jgi:isopentenyldiphosphate isomerase